MLSKFYYFNFFFVFFMHSSPAISFVTMCLKSGAFWQWKNKEGSLGFSQTINLISFSFHILLIFRFFASFIKYYAKDARQLLINLIRYFFQHQYNMVQWAQTFALYLLKNSDGLSKGKPSRSPTLINVYSSKGKDDNSQIWVGRSVGESDCAQEKRNYLNRGCSSLYLMNIFIFSQ